MMRDVEKLREAMQTERIKPRPAARDAAVAAALAAYDAKKESRHQGSSLVGRLRNAARAASEIITGQRPMTQISMRHALTAGASLAVLPLAVMTAANLHTIENLSRHGEPEPVAVPPAAPVLRDLTKEAAKQETL